MAVLLRTEFVKDCRTTCIITKKPKFYGKGKKAPEQSLPFCMPIDDTTIIVPLHIGIKYAEHCNTKVKAGSCMIVPNNSIVAARWQTAPLLERQQPVFDYAINHFRQYRTLTLELYTGFGKSILASSIAGTLGLRTLVITPAVALAFQWQKSMQKYTNARIVVAEPGADYTNADIICAYSERVYRKGSPAPGIPFEILRSIGTLILDELPYLCTSQDCYSMISVFPQYVIGCTARFWREDDFHKIGKTIMGPHMYSIKLNKVFPVYRVNGVRPIIKYDKEGNKQYALSNKTLFVNEDNSTRMDYMYIIWKIVIETLLPQGHKPLLLFFAEENLYRVRDVLVQSGYRVAEFHGSVKSYNDGDILMGTYGKMSFGFDEESASEDWNGKRISAFVICDSIKSLTSFEQSVGRVMRAIYPLVIDIVHQDDMYERHYDKRLQWYREVLGHGYTPAVWNLFG